MQQIDQHVLQQFGVRRNGESLLYVVIAMVLAMACLELLIPWFNTYAAANLAFAYWRDPALLGTLVTLVFAIGVLAGIYPALTLSSFRPASVLKGGPLKSAGAGIVRTGLVILPPAATQNPPPVATPKSPT